MSPYSFQTLPSKNKPAPPNKYSFPTDPNEVGKHNPFHTPSGTSSPTVDDTIQITTDQLNAWAKLFEQAAVKLNLAGDSMNRINVQPGYFQEAQTVRTLATRFNETFVPNLRVLSDSSSYVARALVLVSQAFSDVEAANLDTNSDLVDMISAVTKLKTSLKTTTPVTPNTPGA